ncbi:hypothetical protein Dimus_031272 [Dionaea muscipula]
MREFSCDSNGGSCPAYYGDNGFLNSQYYWGFLPKGISDSYPGYDKDILKQTMLEHEAIFKNQVYELHRLYRVQRDLMDEFKRKEGYKLRTPYETSSSSSPLASQIPSEYALKWNASSFPLAKEMSGRLPISAQGQDIVQYSVNKGKGKNIQVGLVPSQNCSSPKGSEGSESRPTKFRRKMLDLRLPADDYIDIDEVEQCGEEANCPPDVNHRSVSESGVKLFLNHHEKIECNGDDGVRSNSMQRKFNTLADLNEPVLVEEPTVFPSTEFSGTAMPRDISQNSQHGRSINEASNNVRLENKGKGQGWFSYILEAEKSREELSTMLPSLEVEKVPATSQSVQFQLESAWRTKTGVAFGAPERSYFHSGSNNSESFLPVHGPTHSSFPHSELVNSWDHSVLSWGKSSSLSLKSMSVQPNPFITCATLSKSSVQSNEFLWNMGPANSSLRAANLDFGSEIPVRNGFHHGSSAGSREIAGRFPPLIIGSANRGNDDKTSLGSGGDYFKTSTPHIDMSTKKDLNLNELSNGFPTYQNSHQYHPLKIMDTAQKQQDNNNPPPALPWLAGGNNRPCSMEAASASPRKATDSLESVLIQTPSELLFSNNDLKKSLNRLNSLASTSRNGMRHEADDSRSSRTILGVPVFEKPLVSKHDEATASLASPSCRPHPSRGEEMDTCVSKRGFDINIPYDPLLSEMVLEKKVGTGCAGLRRHIDLNSCASDDDDDDVPPVDTLMKRVINIDLEAPAEPEIEDCDLDTLAEPHNPVVEQHNPVVEQPQVREDEEEEAVAEAEAEAEAVAVAVAEAELARVAAEGIVDISTSVLQRHLHLVDSPASLHPMEDLDSSENHPLHWFADVISSCMDDMNKGFLLAKHDGDGVGVEEDCCLSSDSGYYESVTLKLTECDDYDVEEFLSKASVEGTGTNVSLSGSRARRGQGRRGRQRRDFQRDILPGLTSLSRHEVTEDLQTFGGLMRATGHAWHSGPRRNATRNGCGRGRRRTLVAPSPLPPPPPPPPAAANTVCALLKQQPTTTTTTTSPVQLEDKSLTGWGRITRRPRRQRFPAGNPAAAVALT